MVTDKLRKYLLPNIPYVFIGWAFLKLGTAYRLAAGSDFAHKLIVTANNTALQSAVSDRQDHSNQSVADVLPNLSSG